MKTTLLLCLALIAGCQAARSEPTATASYLDACEIVKERRAELDSAIAMKIELKRLNPTIDEMESADNAIGIRAKQYQQALAIRKQFEPKLKAN